MKIIHPSRLAVVIVALLLVGCAGIEVGRSFELQTFESSVQRGVTTQDDVRHWLGAPHATGIVVDPDGRRAVRWNYYHGQGFPGRADSRFRTLEIRFDEARRVEAYNWSSSD